jgi:hypothetical protein
LKLELRKCEFCGKKFSVDYPKRRFYSFQCFINHHKKSYIEKKCLECGKIFYVPKYKSIRKFCSNRCATIYNNKHGKIGINKKLKENNFWWGIMNPLSTDNILIEKYNELRRILGDYETRILYKKLSSLAEKVFRKKLETEGYIVYHENSIDFIAIKEDPFEIRFIELKLVASTKYISKAFSRPRRIILNYLIQHGIPIEIYLAIPKWLLGGRKNEFEFRKLETQAKNNNT